MHVELQCIVPYLIASTMIHSCACPKIRPECASWDSKHKRTDCKCSLHRAALFPVCGDLSEMRMVRNQAGAVKGKGYHSRPVNVYRILAHRKPLVNRCHPSGYLVQGDVPSVDSTGAEHRGRPGVSPGVSARRASVDERARCSLALTFSSSRRLGISLKVVSGDLCLMVGSSGMRVSWV